MSTSPPAAPRRSWLARIAFWCPLLLLAALATAVTSVQFLPTEAGPHVGNSALIMGGMLGWFLFLAWLLIAPLPRSVRGFGLAILLAPVVLVPVYYRVEELSFTGGFWPILQSRFSARPDDVLEQHLQGIVMRAVPDSVNLSGRGTTDWPEYRGRNRDGVVIGPELLRDWSARPPRLLWKHPIGGGHSSFAVADKAIFTLEQRRDHEAITCYDADTGLPFWAFSYPALFDERLGDKGPRSTPTVIDGEVFALGASGLLTCLEARTGKVKWGPVDVLAGNANVDWGLAGSPLVVEDAVLVNAGVQSASAPHGTVIAFDRKTGKPMWSTTSRAHAGYSSPLVATLAGKRQLLLFDGDGLAAYELDDPASKGKELWRFPWPTQKNINVAQPLVLDGDRVFISSGYGVGGAMLHVVPKDGTWSIERLWKKTTMSCKFSSPVYFQGRIYGLDNEYLAAIDAATGKREARGERYKFGQVLLCKDLLLVSGEDGELALVEPSPVALRELGQVQALTGRCWNPAAMADGRVYWRNNREMVCYDLSGR